ncbi:MAG: hypothetical protein NTV06_03530 [candidate division Zixibacteria bacterium]|nr:hypothetical protein [candidate division Zixibacteria bacterium]
MKGSFSSPFWVGCRYFPLGIIAVVFTVVGIFLASGFDFTKHLSASPQIENLPVVSSNNGEYTSPFVPVVERVSDAVVNIVAEQQSPEVYYDDFFYRFFQIPRGSPISFGSGFFFRPDG